MEIPTAGGRFVAQQAIQTRNNIHAVFLLKYVLSSIDASFAEVWKVFIQFHSWHCTNPYSLSAWLPGIPLLLCGMADKRLFRCLPWNSKCTKLAQQSVSTLHMTLWNRNSIQFSLFKGLVPLLGAGVLGCWGALPTASLSPILLHHKLSSPPHSFLIISFYSYSFYFLHHELFTLPYSFIHEPLHQFFHQLTFPPHSCST